MIQSAVALCVLSLLSILLLIPALVWHVKYKNVPAISLICCFLVGNIKTFINAIIWGQDDLMETWDGAGYCDLLIKVDVGAKIGRITSTAAITLNLYMVLCANSPMFLENNWRKLSIELAVCWLTPVFVMCTQYYIQASRYVITPVAGCMASYMHDSATIPLYYMWPLIWCTVALVLACMTVFKYLQKRKDVSDILKCTNSGLNVKRFARLLIFCFLIIGAVMPLSIYVFVKNANLLKVHVPDSIYDRSEIFVSPNTGDVTYDLWVVIGLSLIVFLLFGLGTEAVIMYRTFFRRILGKKDDCLATEPQSRVASNLTETSHATGSTFFEDIEYVKDGTSSFDEKDLETRLDVLDEFQYNFHVEKR